MDKVQGARRFLVVTPYIVVGEDLKEALTTFVDAEVVHVASLDAAVEEEYELAIFGIPLEVVLHDRRVRAMHNAGTQIVILNGHFPKETLAGTGVLALTQPFSTEDVEALLNKAEILEKRKV